MLLIFLTMCLSACDDELGQGSITSKVDSTTIESTTDGSGNTDTTDSESMNSEASTSGSVDEPLAIEDRHISIADSSKTVTAIANGLDPYTTLIDDTFYCSYLDDPYFAQPDEIITFSGSTYSSTTGTGNIEQLIDNEDADLVFRGGPLDEVAINVAFDNAGQSFRMALQNRKADCFQSGAAIERALKRYLRTFTKGDTYTCRNADNGKEVDLLLSDLGTYTMGNTQGTWYESEGIEYGPVTVTFSGGALEGNSVDYFEQDDTGYRSFDSMKSSTNGLFDNGQSTGPSTLNCWAFGPPKALPVYGSKPAPAPTRSTLPLTGRYVRSIEVRTISKDSHDAEHFWFEPNGYVYRGATPHIGVDCNRTAPNGLPFCETYEFDGQNLKIYSALGTQLESYSATSIGTQLTHIGDHEAIPASLIPATPKAGLWTNLTWWNYGCVGGSCSNGFKKREYAINDEGRFIYTTWFMTLAQFNENSPSRWTMAVSQSMAKCIAIWVGRRNDLLALSDFNHGKG